MTCPDSDRHDIPPKLENEPSRNYQYFLLFCLMGSARSLASTAEMIGKSPRTVETLSSDFRWQERAKSYDDRFIVDTALEARKKNISRFSSFFEANISLSERAIKVSETILEALESTVERMDQDDYSGKIAKVLAASKACELLSRTVKNNQDLFIGLSGLEVLAKQLLDRDKDPKPLRDKYTPLRDRIEEDRAYEKTTFKGGLMDTTKI